MHAATKRTSAVRLFTNLFNSRKCAGADVLRAVVDSRKTYAADFDGGLRVPAQMRKQMVEDMKKWRATDDR
jgi:hypothetical protein